MTAFRGYVIAKDIAEIGKVFVCGLSAILISCDAGFVTASDAKQANRIGKAIHNEMALGGALADVQIEKLYCGPSATGPIVDVYGLAAHDDQEKVIRAIQAIADQQAVDPIHLTFFEKEIWIESEGDRVRGYERQLRRVVIQGSAGSKPD